MENLTPDELEKRKETNKIIFSVLLISLILFVVVLSITKDDKKEVSSPTLNKSKIPIDTIKHNWIYSEEEDSMDNSKYRYSYCTSINTVELSFPYSGGTKLDINLRNGFNHKGNEVYLTVNQGQFMSSFDGEETIRMKFDNSPPVSYRFQNESSGKTTTIFLSNSNSIIEKLKKSKKVIVEVEFYNNGISRFMFDVEGLKWGNKKKK